MLVVIGQPGVTDAVSSSAITIANTTIRSNIALADSGGGARVRIRGSNVENTTVDFVEVVVLSNQAGTR